MCMMVYFYILVFTEQHIIFFKRGGNNLKETMTSLNHGIFYESCRLFTHKLEAPVYFFIYKRIGKMALSKFEEEEFAWIACCIGFIATDFCYYWVHRLKHG
ncbi:hypothetical protein HN011_011631 [Eciton burchellii]|nr:hypothetical protein HN011_011631 [Eciton burchellii]